MGILKKYDGDVHVRIEFVDSSERSEYWPPDWFSALMLPAMRNHEDWVRVRSTTFNLRQIRRIEQIDG